MTTKSKITNSDRQRTTAASAPGRETRAAEDNPRREDATMMTSAERAAMLRDEFRQEALPTPPKLTGWHLCWLSTTNSYDPISKRMRIGYVPVQINEVAGFDEYSVKEGEWTGCISCNEMVLFKIDEQTYQEIMTLFHHTMPMEEEAKIKEKLQQLQGEGKTDVELEEGFKELAVHKQGKF